jgi:ribosomal protein S18 acetylase RimI-like enzyme
VPVRRDAWLSAALGRDAYAADAGDPIEAAGFYYAKCDVQDVASASRLEDEGFRVVDVNITLEAGGTAVQQSAAPGDVGPARSDERGDVLAIAESCFRYSRFHLDPLIANDVANGVKRKWIESYFDGARGDELLIARLDGRPAGFLAVLRADDATLIDLVGVATEAQGKGIGSALVSSFAKRHGTGTTLRVGTQIANTPSLRLYRRCGFAIERAAYVFHLHRDES